MVSNSPLRSASPMSVRSNPNPNLNPNSNSNPRKSFNGCFSKKGFVPNTPLNSPAEYARCSFGRESSGVPFRDHEQKENERDLNIKPIARARSPSIVTAKGAKNFMSPTISAASKINPSPRKKVLGERNDAIRTSASLSDGKFHFFTANLLDFESETEPKSLIEPMSFDKAENEVKFEAFEADLVVLSPEVPLNVVKSSESLPLSEMPKMVADEDTTSDASLDAVTTSDASLDALVDSSLDSLPPYDPKNNFLSPRPQFLHYNPNWRTENYVNQGVNLEDDFTSESVSETENSSEEVQSEESSFEGVSPEEMPQLSEEQATESEEVVAMVEPALESKRSRLFNWKFAAVLLLLSVGFMSISSTYPNITGNAMYRDEVISRVYNSPQATALVENFNVLIQNVQIWSALSADYLSQMLDNLKGVEKFSPLAFGNLTAWQEAENRGFVVEKFDLLPYFESFEHAHTVAQAEMHAEPEDDETFADGAEIVELDAWQEAENLGFVVENFESIEDDHTVIHAEPEEEAEQIPEIEVQSFPENNDDASTKDDEFIMQNIEVEEEASVQKQSATPEDNEDSIGVNVLVKADESANVAVDVQPVDTEKEPMETDTTEPHTESAMHKVTDDTSSKGDEFIKQHYDNEDDSAAQMQSSTPEENGASKAVEVQPVETENEPSDKANISPADDVQPVETDITEPVTEGAVDKATDENSQLPEENEKSLVPVVASIILVIVTLIAALMYMKSKKDGPSTVQQFMPEVEPSLSVTPSSRSGPIEVDMVGESCPSEMSSFQNTAYTKSKQRERAGGDNEVDSLQKGTKQRERAGGDNEVDSLQKGTKRSTKRESLASSSSEYTMNSSYGSFSTYSVIQPKHGDDQVVTPVRRSSRIRSKVTSP